MKMQFPALQSLICVELSRCGVFLAAFTGLYEQTEAPPPADLVSTTNELVKLAV